MEHGIVEVKRPVVELTDWESKIIKEALKDYVNRMEGAKDGPNRARIMTARRLIGSELGIIV